MEKLTVIIITIIIIIITTLLLIIYYLLNKSSKIKELIDLSTGIKLQESKLNKIDSKNDNKLLNPAVFKPFTILSIKQVSYNTKLFRFEIPFNKSLDLPIGRHISIQVIIDDNKVIRAYTPVSSMKTHGYFDLLIKSYEYGKLSKYMHNLKPGQSVNIRGPIGRFNYTRNTYPLIGLIAGGTGITPCLQLIRGILEGQTSDEVEKDNTNFILFYQNRSEEDILLKGEIDKLTSTHSNRLTVSYYLSNQSTNEWGNNNNERSGSIKQSDIQNELGYNICPYICICGPTGFNDKMKQLLFQSGHSDDSVYVW